MLRVGCVGFFGLVLCLVLSWSAFAETVWNPQEPGVLMSEHVYNNDGIHRRVIWAEHGGFTIKLDDTAVYDNNLSVDEAPRVHVDLNSNQIHLLDTNFVLTVQTKLDPNYGAQFHTGLFIAFGDKDLLIFGPHGSTNLRLYRESSINYWQDYTESTVFLKLKRSGSTYSAWYSADGVIWSRATTVTASKKPCAVGCILKNWGTPHAESVTFKYFEVTHIENEPVKYMPNTKYGKTNENALHFIFDLSGIDILFRLFIRQADGNAGNPANKKLYLIHGAGTTGGRYNAILTYNRITNDLLNDNESYHDVNMLCVALRYLRGEHPYPSRAGFSYQSLRAEEDWMLMHLHEDFIRERFPADQEPTDDRFYLVGHSGGGQYVARFSMAHAKKLNKAVISSPAGYAFPFFELEWPEGILLDDVTTHNNPRLTIDLPSIFALPIAVVIGDNDNIIDRGVEHNHYDPKPLSYSRRDEALKWVRQMAKASNEQSNIRLYIVPRVGHGYWKQKRIISLLFLFGEATELKTYDKWIYSFALNNQDNEVPLNPDLVPDTVFSYFKFNHFALPSGTFLTRFEFRPDKQCYLSNKDGLVTSTTTWDLIRHKGEVVLTVQGERFANPSLYYGKIRLYNASRDRMLEESSACTRHFIQDHVVSQILYLFRAADRQLSGPIGIPYIYKVLQLNPDNTVIDPLKGQPFSLTTMQRWYYDNQKHLLYFTDMSGKAYNFIRIGEWRWDYRANGQAFLAGLCTHEITGVDRYEIQVNSSYNPQYFEGWDTRFMTRDSGGDRMPYDLEVENYLNPLRKQCWRGRQWR